MLLVCGALALGCSAAKIRYSNSWAVEIRGGPEAADEMAQKHGFVNHGQVSFVGC